MRLTPHFDAHPHPWGVAAHPCSPPPPAHPEESGARGESGAADCAHEPEPRGGEASCGAAAGGAEGGRGAAGLSTGKGAAGVSTGRGHLEESAVDVTAHRSEALDPAPVGKETRDGDHRRHLELLEVGHLGEPHFPRLFGGGGGGGGE